MVKKLKEKIIILIPAYNPDKELIKLVKELTENYKIIVINDGSDSKKYFNAIKKDCKILEHSVNKGKGRALKTGFRYIIENYHNAIGVVTIDADGQHDIQDIYKICEVFKQQSDILIFGKRNFDSKEIPFRSRIGNKMISRLIEKKTRKNIGDTQTGLRAIPIKYLKDFERIYGERFEYETNVLLYCIKQKINIHEIAIKSIYKNKNKMSHFRMLRDSMIIYNQLRKKLRGK